MPRNYIVFDLDGTLVDTTRTVLNAFNHALQPFDLSVTPEHVERMRSMTSAELFRDMLSEHDARIALARLWEHSHASAGESILIPGVDTMLKLLAERQLTLGVWTGRDRSSAMNILDSHQISHHFQALVGGCEVARNKPDPEGLLLLASRLNAPAHTLIHVGDHSHDLHGAQAAGAISVIVNWCDTQPQTCPEHVLSLADFRFNSIDEFNQGLDLILKR